MTALSETKRYQAYPEYKDSGVEWLDDIPKDWCTRRLKHMLESPMSYGANEAAERAVSAEPRYIRITDMNSDGTLKEDTFRSLPRDIASDYLLKDRDILLARSGATVGKSFIYRKEFGDCCFAGYLIKVSCDSTKLNSDYAFWFFQSSSYWQYISGSQIQATIQNVSAEKYGEMYISLPEHVDEQTQIANFLDHETAKIDTLIEKQQQLIKLLKEKRQAVISHAVTKGLNPQAPMKDSGVEWLGEVPEHWAVMKFNHCAQIRNGLVDPKGTKYRDMVLYAPNHIEKATGKVLYRETASEQGADSNKYLCYQGEVIYSKIRPALAKVAICTEELALCSADMYPISCINGLTNEWLYWFMLSDSFTKAVVLDSDRVAMPKVNRESLGDYKIPFPTESEQSDISSHIKAQTQKLDVLEAKANNAIKLMQERRTALISAAVTGKIDVRNWQAPISQEQGLEQTA
ncbi:restriction endonuclease subunit S [Vibrio parahaemolyticus]